MSKPRRQSPDLSPDLGERERAYVFSVAMKYVKDEVEADDVTQEALLLAHRHRHSFRGDSRYSTWLYRITATTALMHLRRQKRRKSEILTPVRRGDEDGPAFLDAADPCSGPEERTGARQVIAHVADEVAELGPKYENVFWLRHHDGYSEAEVAQRLDLPLTTVKTRSFRARRAIIDRCGTLAA